MNADRALLAHWAMKQDRPVKQRLAFNIDPFGTLVRIGKVSGGLDAAFARCAELTQVLALKFPAATALRVDARPIHEAGGTEAQELGALLLRHSQVTGFRIERGAIINISSRSAMGGNVKNGPYGASKAALERIIVAAAAELGPAGIRANAINPGPTDTGWMPPQQLAALAAQVPLGRVSLPEDAAALVAFLLSPDGGWITGQILTIDGGLTATQ